MITASFGRAKPERLDLLLVVGGAAVMSLVAIAGTPHHLMGLAMVWCVAAFYGVCGLAKPAAAPLGE